MKIGWKNLLAQGNFPNFVGSLVNRMSSHVDARELLVGFEKKWRERSVRKIQI